jgi:predicted RNase H-like HicB family nuclease
MLPSMTEIVFRVEEDPEGGFVAEAVGRGVFTQADTIEELHEMVRDAVRCHFEGEAEAPKLIRLHFVRDEVIAG